MPRGLTTLVVVVVTLTAAAAGAKREAQPTKRPRSLLAPFGGAGGRLLEPNSAPPAQQGASTDSGAPPMVQVSGSASPRLKLRKRIPTMDGAHVGCTIELDGATHFDAAVREPWLRGRVELKGQRVEWRKMWLFPGLVDAATRVELRSAVDLRDGRARSEFRLGLRGVRSTGLSLVHRVAVGSGRVGPWTCDCSVDVGATLVVPDEFTLSLSGGDGGGNVEETIRDARISADFDRLDVCLDL